MWVVLKIDPFSCISIIHATNTAFELETQIADFELIEAFIHSTYAELFNMMFQTLETAKELGIISS